jgi:chaperonin GroES
MNFVEQIGGRSTYARNCGLIGDRVINLPELWRNVFQSFPPYFLGTLASAAFGAFAGAWINSRVQTKRVVVAELNSVSAAMSLCFSICNISIGLKRQYVAPMHDAYERTLKEYAEAVATLKLGHHRSVFVLRADLQTLLPPKMPTELLERCVFEKISIRGRALAAAVQLVGSIDGLASAIEGRNDVIKELQGAPDRKLREEKYLGLRSAEGVTDDRYRASIKGIFDQTNDCIFFSRILAEDLLKYGNHLRKRCVRRLMLGLPKLAAADWSTAERAGLMPSADLYKAWLDGFKANPSIWLRLRYWAASQIRRGRVSSPCSVAPPPSGLNVGAAKGKLRPSRDRVIVRRVEAEEKTIGGIIIPDTVREKSQQQGYVLAVGPGVRSKRGKLIPVDLRIGDKVLFERRAGIEIKLDGENLLIMNENDVIGVIVAQ